MDLCELYRPQCYEDFVGDKSVLRQLEDYVKNDVPTLLIGPPGVGKTTMAYLVAKELGMSVLETNASDKRKKDDLKEFERNFKTKSLIETLFLFEEIDGMDSSNQKLLSELVKKVSKPIVITANDKMKVDLALKKYCKLIEVKLTNRDLQSIINRVKVIAQKEGIKDPKYKKVNLDLRSSIKCILENSHGYEPESNNFEKVTRILKKEKVESIRSSRKNKEVTIPWVLDNLSNFYNGLDIYKSVRILGIVAETGDLNILSCLPEGKGKARYPDYLRKKGSKYAKYSK